MPHVVKAAGGIHFMRFDVDGETTKGLAISGKDGSIIDSFVVQRPE